jgi:tRNA A37 threonylcarbamoyladenosine modification protein TsaB
MDIKIILEKNEVIIELRDGQKLVDTIKSEEKNSLSMVLLPNIDLLLKKNQVSKNRIKKVSVKNNFPDFYTSSRIAESVAKSFNFCQKII